VTGVTTTRRRTPAKATATANPATATAATAPDVTAEESQQQRRNPARRYAATLRVAHLTPEQRVARGRAARNEVPRAAHGYWEPAADREDPVTILMRQAESRVPELVPIRYGRMVSSPFAFYRGAAAVMAADLASTPVSGLRVQAVGDAHLSNFGVFASAERRLVFDVNDFDETLPGPWEWDVKRLAASLEIAGRSNGFTDPERQKVVLDAVAGYRTAMAQFAGMRTIDVWYAAMDVDALVAQFGAMATKEQRRRTEKTLEKARTRDHLRAFNKLVTIVDGKPQFISQPPLLVPVEELASDIPAEALHEAIRGALRSYRATLTSDRRHLLEGYEYQQLARKVVGVGSVGTRAWVALLRGRDESDPLLIQIKEAQASVLEAHVGRSEYANAGHRVVAGQRLIQASSDIFLGWQRISQGLDGQARDFYVRQLNDWKGSAEVEQMVPTGMAAYARMCGWTLARGHARSGDRIAITSYLGANDRFDRAIAQFAIAYADQNDKDHALLVDAVKSGRVQAQEGI
jgi:uncharacterized protein (DUF2252 family)